MKLNCDYSHSEGENTTSDGDPIQYSLENSTLQNWISSVQDSIKIFIYDLQNIYKPLKETWGLQY